MERCPGCCEHQQELNECNHVWDGKHYRMIGYLCWECMEQESCECTWHSYVENGNIIPKLHTCKLCFSKMELFGKDNRAA